MKKGDTRRTDRVTITIPIEVSGKDVRGRGFEERAHTLVVNRHGAAIAVSRKLGPGELVAILCKTSKKKTNARVVGLLGGQVGGHVYGVTLTDPEINLWGIEFPPLTESEKAVVRMLMQCMKCQGTEVAYLNELETEVFEANLTLARLCKKCEDWTIWKPAPREAEAAADSPAKAAYGADRAGGLRRRDIRVRLHTKACIRQMGFEDEIVPVQDVSRGGFSFLSARRYTDGSRIEVAIPYLQGTAMIFVPARIVRSQEALETDQRKYGARYLKPSKESFPI